ncbi:MAG TPA: DISARM system helicase DrmA [Acidobacteriaceae bacterium]|nr:DISARM system helicase DrmA [Acidobacteriaceae bacterium]
MPAETTSAHVRGKLIDALKLDLVGPQQGLGDAAEVLPQSPSRWYLTGFLAPLDGPAEQRSDADADDDLDSGGEPGLDDDVTPDPSAAAKQKYLPGSIGVSVLLPKEAKTLTVRVSWGDYRRKSDGAGSEQWTREPREETVPLDLVDKLDSPTEKKVPKSSGLTVALTILPVGKFGPEAGLKDGARTISVFIVNRRTPKGDEIRDEAFAFQTELRLTADQPFLERPNTRGLLSDDWDENVADLQYRDVGEYAVGHNVAASGNPREVRTCWIPEAQVERVAPASIEGVSLGMDELATLVDGAEARAKLMPLVAHYREWIESQRAKAPASPRKRAATAKSLLDNGSVAADRIERGISLLADPECLKAFRLANQSMGTAARRRFGPMQNKPIESVKAPSWRPFQLAFLLMNLPGIAEPEGNDREIVDLLFFPTGGGKTEAYLGLAAFSLLLRRLRNPGITGAGLCVLMRYTLRLLTLDQLSRAATLMCALELLREADPSLGDWPFEIGLWVGRAATPNEMGSKDRDHPETARRRTIAFWNDSSKPSPVPLEECPWCGTKFQRESFRLTANGRINRDYPDELQIACINRDCDFNRDRTLPIVAVDEPMYRRLPCFMIATVDKFAGMPWTGKIAGFFGRVQRYDKAGFYGPMEPGRGSLLPNGQLLPPDLIIQDELHLISGPLGTMVGLYETALEELAVRGKVRPKIVASTATVRRADSQIQALFNRDQVDIFPPPGPDRRDSFFACTLKPEEGNGQTNPRLYVGIAAQGRSPKVAMLRVYLALLGAGELSYQELKKSSPNPADPYMTLVGYFNALRELGGARRLIEDEVRNRLERYGTRKRVGEEFGLFADREIAYEPVELTSRVDTSKVSEAKAKLARPFTEKNHADVAIATNMISVGLDITRLGLMVVFGQPKTSAEYIQASSRVGRDPERPGLVVTLLNVHKPRDRSHYERFCAYHETFYRSVEATSVTPFSPRALDRGLAASLVALSRLGLEVMTPPLGAMEILNQRNSLESVVERFGGRAFNHNKLGTEERNRLRQAVRQRCGDLLDEWARVVQDQKQVGAGLQYNPHEHGTGVPLLQDFLDPSLKNLPSGNWKMKFRANRSLRNVEPNVNMWVRSLEGFDLDED